LKKTVCIDLDDTLIDFSAGWQDIYTFGDPFPGAVEFTKKIAVFADIIIHTCRCTPEAMGINNGPLLQKKVKDYLDSKGFIYHDIWIGEGKPVADAYIDDRAVFCGPRIAQNKEKVYDTAVSFCKLICKI